MKRLLIVSVLFVAASLLLGGCSRPASFRPASGVRLASFESSSAQTGPGLLLIAHGSPSADWNRPLLDLESDVQHKLNEQGSPFLAVKLVFMEFAAPSVADGVELMESAGCDRIVVVPLLIAPSTHSHRDIPSLLGLYADEQVLAILRAEGATPVRSRLPITITPTLDQGELLETVLLQRVHELSQEPENEALVVLAHGDDAFAPVWDSRMKKLITSLCGTTGISYGDYAFVHVGQGYALNGVPVIAAAAENRPRVLVVGCYVSMGAIGMHHRYMHTAVSMGGVTLPNPLEGKNVVLTTRGLLPNPLVADWIIGAAERALQ